MNLPNADQATIDSRKVAEYLLNENHPDNGGKARFFERLGYGRHNAALLAESLRDLAHSTTVARVVNSRHGEKYVVEGLLRGPSGMASRLRTIWIIDRGATPPRPVTAYPID